MSYQTWTKEAPFQTRDGRTLWPVYAPGAHGSKTDGGTIYVHDQDIDLDDVEYPPGARRRVGQLTFQRHEIAYVEVNEAWQRQHVPQQMYELAKHKDPQLRHSTRHRSPDVYRYVDADQAKQWMIRAEVDEAAVSEAFPDVEEERGPGQPQADDTPTGRHLTVRHVVRGHWRQQYHPSDDSHQPKWIASYLKGPEGAPLHLTQQVMVWRR